MNQFMKRTVKLAAFVFLMLGTFTSLATINRDDDWQSYVSDLLNQFLSCTADMAGPNGKQYPCNKFLVMALDKVYGIKDFYDAQGKALLANQIIQQMRITPDTWTRLGTGADQNVLTQAQGYANHKKAVVATLYVPGSVGHVVLVLPGDLVASGSWGMHVPNSASFFLNKPNKSYVSGPLSKAFSAADKGNVEIWGRSF